MSKNSNWAAVKSVVYAIIKVKTIRLLIANRFYNTELKTKGLDVTNWIPELTASKDETVTDDAEKDAAQSLAKIKVKKANASREHCYKMTSSRLDAVMGVLGKNTDAAKQAARLRSSLTGKVKKKKVDKPAT